MNIAGSDVQADTGNITATTQRVTIALDDEVNNSLVTMADWDAQHDVLAVTHGIQSMAQSRFFDGSAFPAPVSTESDAVILSASKYGVQFSTLVTDTGGDTMCFGDNLPATATPGLLTTGGVYRATADTYADNDACVNQHDINGNLKTTHSITGGADDVTTVTTAGTDVVLGGDVACKKIDIQAQTDNTGLIAVGFTGVDATEATGTGVILYAGDTYSLEINNLNLIYIDSTEDGEGVRYTYFT